MSKKKFLIFLFFILICIIIFETTLLVINYFDGFNKFFGKNNVQPTQAQIVTPTVENEPISTDPVYPTWASQCNTDAVKLEYVGNSKTVIAKVKASMPKYNGMRFFYMNKAQITDPINADYGSANCDGPFTISGKFVYEGIKISFMQGFWGKGDLCDFEMDVQFNGKTVSVCGEVIDPTGKGGDNSYSIYLVGPTESKDVTYEAWLNITGHYTNTEIEKILKDVIELK
jgi:hypothetical protein